MTALPPDLQALDGHPHAALAADLWADLTRIGLPVRLAIGDPPDESGVVISPDTTGISVCWRVPGHETAEAAAIDFSTAMAEEADACSAAGHVLHAAAVLTTALAGILVSHGYHLGGAYLGPGSRFVVTGSVHSDDVVITIRTDDMP